MDNKAIAGLLYETADLLEIDGQDSFRVRSYRNAAEAIEALPRQVADLIQEPKKLLEIQGIGKGMLANLQMLFKDGRIEAHAELLKKYRPSMLELLKIQGLGPKTIALIWSAHQVSDLEGVEKLAREGKIRELPRMGEKHEQKLLKAIEDYRRIAGRFLLDTAEQLAEKLVEHLFAIPGIEKVTPAGSLRRGRETVGDLDILVTGEACIEAEPRPGTRCRRCSNYPTSAATCICTPSKPTAAIASKRWPKQPMNAATSTWRSPTTQKIWPSPTASPTNARSRILRESGRLKKR